MNIHLLGIHCLHTAEFDTTKNKFNYFKDKNCVTFFCGFKRTCNKITENKEMTSLTNEERKTSCIKSFVYM